MGLQIDGIISTLGSRFDASFKLAAAPPTTNQLIDAMNTGPSTLFPQGVKVFDFTSDSAKQFNLVTSARLIALHANLMAWQSGFRSLPPGGTTDTLGCEALVLACNGYGAKLALGLPTYLGDG